MVILGYHYILENFPKNVGGFRWKSAVYSTNYWPKETRFQCKKHPLRRKVLFAPETRCSTSKKFQRKPPIISTKVFGAWTTPGLTVPFSGKKDGEFDLFFGFVEGKWHFPEFFFAVCHIFFWLNSFSHSFPGFHFRAFNGRGAIEPLGVAWFSRVVTWEFRKQKMQQKRGETFTCSWVILSVWEYLFIGEVFVLRSPLTHFDTESNIIIEPNAQVTRRSFRNLNCWDFFPRKIWEKGSNWTRRWKRWYINWRTHDTIIIVWDAPHCQ